MNLTRNQLAMCQDALQEKSDNLRNKIAELGRQGFSESRGTIEHREELLRVACLRNEIQQFLLQDANFPNPRNT